MDWATSPAETRGVQPPKTPAEFTEWKKTHTSIEIWVRFYFVEKRWIFYICRRARLRSRQLGQTVVSPSRRLSRLDNKPSSAITAPCGGSRPIGKRTRRAKREPSPASASISGCVQRLPYACKPSLLTHGTPRPSAQSIPDSGLDAASLRAVHVLLSFLSLCFLCLPCRNWRGLRMIRPIGSARRLRRGKWEEGRGRTRARLPVRQGWRRLASPRWFCAEAKDARVVHLGHALPAGPANCGSGVTGLTTGGRMGV
jgi:hypothetical protein